MQLCTRFLLHTYCVAADFWAAELASDRKSLAGFYGVFALLHALKRAGRRGVGERVSGSTAPITHDLSMTLQIWQSALLNRRADS